MPVELAAYLNDHRRLIDERLAGYLDGETGCPAELLVALRYCLLAPGKRLRPILVLMACEACGGSVTAALPAACAIEMIHTYSLVHDDLPAMDDDDLRRGRATCHKQFNEATAILVGDGLLTLAFQVLSAETQPPALAARLCTELARCAGVAGMVGGQHEDLNWQGRGSGTAETIQAIHEKKTGALFNACLRMGGMIGLSATNGSVWIEYSNRPAEDGKASRTLHALGRYAESLGLAFQISDDLLDVEGTAAATGKRVGKDAARGKLTYPGLLGVAESRCRLREACEKARDQVRPLGVPAQRLLELVEFIEERTR